MKLHQFLVSVTAGILITLGQVAPANADADAAAMKKTLNEDQKAHKECLGCHINVTPGIVTQ
ncbi:MAG TPA: hypothetical protein PLZ16_10675, partial [Gammaproteobacteria bacterium]|nr:hypothetical protein [Gammaproteobacteria bacterium]